MFYWKNLYKWLFTHSSLIWLSTFCPTDYRGQRSVRTTPIGSTFNLVFRREQNYCLSYGQLSQTNDLVKFVDDSTMWDVLHIEILNLYSPHPWRHAKNGHVIITWNWTLQRRKRCAWISRLVHPSIRQLWLTIKRSALSSMPNYWNLHVNAIGKKASKRLCIRIIIQFRVY